MTNPDGAIDLYYALKPAKYGFLESLNLTRSVDPAKWNGFDLVLRLVSSAEPHSTSLHLEFKGVKELRIGSVDGLLRYLVDIRSLREMQHEGRNYRIVESEYNVFSFVCSDFIAKVGD